MPNPLLDTKVWFELAVPNPTTKNINAQTGVHFEEVVEMLDELGGLSPESQQLIANAKTHLKRLATFLKEAGANIHEFPADWEFYGKRAGFVRNKEMAALADVGLGFWDGKSKGTKHMIDEMKRLNKPLYVVRYD